MIQTFRVKTIAASLAMGAIVFLSGAQIAHAQQWNTAGSNINSANSGNVGVGTSSPSAGKLQVAADANAVDLLSLQDTGTGGLTWRLGPRTGGGGAGIFGIYNGTTQVAAFGSSNSWINPYGGNVGIGTTGPYWKLTVNDPTVAYNSDAGNIAVTNSSDTTKRLLFGIDTVWGQTVPALSSQSNPEPAQPLYYCRLKVATSASARRVREINSLCQRLIMQMHKHYLGFNVQMD
jgi:hypothetical protein